MSENVSRTTISIAPAVMKGGLERAKKLGYKNFSAYIAHLIAQDVKERPDHISVRSEHAQSALKTLLIETPPHYGGLRAAEKPEEK